MDDRTPNVNKHTLIPEDKKSQSKLVSKLI